MSIFLQGLFCFLFLAIIYASYIHNTEWYHRIFALFPDFGKVSRFWKSEFVKIEMLVPREQAESIRHVVKTTHPGVDPIIVKTPSDGGEHAAHGHDAHGH